MQGIYSDMMEYYHKWLSENTNGLVITPKENLREKYNWLKDSRRDPQMGSLSSANRRTLVLGPGTYTLTQTLVLDTDYVDIVTIAKLQKDTIITRAGGGPTVKQTANNISLWGFTIKNTGNDPGDTTFIIDAVDNAPSLYCFMHFRHSNPYHVVENTWRCPVLGYSNINGTWIFCEGDAYTWCLQDNKDLGATMLFCKGGDDSFGGDGQSISLSGIFRHCEGGHESFAGGWGLTCKIGPKALLEDCIAGDFSFARSREFEGTAIRCRGGKDCFGSTTNPVYPGKFSGYAYDCTAETGNNFGMGHINSVVSGQIINCRLGSIDRYREGLLCSKIATFTDAGVRATLTTTLVGANNDLTYTAKLKGQEGNKINIQYTTKGKGELEVLVTNFTISVRWVAASAPTAAQVKAVVEASLEAMALLESVTIAEGDGSGQVTTMPPTPLAGGKDSPCFKDNHPYLPSSHTATPVSVYPVDSGHTYTNNGTGIGIVFTLPYAWVGLKFSFLVMSAQNLDIDPKNTEQIYDEGVGKGNGKYARSNAVGSTITLECIIAGRWDVTHKHGDWTYEE